jgi:hypothetical protein
MKLISVLLTLAAISVSVVGIGFLILWLRGVKVILLPGLGFIVATPVIVFLLLIVAFVFLLLAMLAKSVS